jgi:hypothetical protein
VSDKPVDQAVLDRQRHCQHSVIRGPCDPQPICPKCGLVNPPSATAAPAQPYYPFGVKP